MCTAIFSGSFDPITNGHLSLIRSASPLFSRLVVVVAENLAKKRWFSLAERKEMVDLCIADLDNVTCETTDGVLVEFAKKIGAQVIIRGIRSTADAEYEIELSKVNYKIAPEVITIGMIADPAYAEVSSTMLKQQVAEGKDVSALCPDVIRKKLEERFVDQQRETGSVV